MAIHSAVGSALVALFVVTLVGCSQQQPAAPTDDAERLAPVPPPPPRMPTEVHLRERALALGAGDCGDLKRIRHLVPKSGQLGHDLYYDRIYTHQADYRACLIESLSDATPIPPVHSGPGLRITNVGDMAYHMLGDMHAVPPNDCVPKTIKTEMEAQGVHAFHRWRHEPANRRQWVACIQRHFARQG